MIIGDIDMDPVFKRILSIQSLYEVTHEGYAWCTWFSGFENSVADVMPEGTGELRVRAAMKILGAQGYVFGCHCGCRGDYELTDKGLAYALQL
jgi:Phenylacetic acid-responsive transcriptional repressor